MGNACFGLFGLSSRRRSERTSLLRAKYQRRKSGSKKESDFACSDHCATCCKTFGLTLRRHHCRRCKNSFCAAHSSRRAVVSVGLKKERVCASCYRYLKDLN